MLRPGALAAGGAIVAGILMVLVPQHGMYVLRGLIVTFAAAAGLFALAVHAPRGSVTRLRVSPFDDSGETRAWTRSKDVDRILARLGKPRRRVPHGPALPPEILLALQRLMRQELESLGLDPDDPADLDVAGRMISADGWAILTAPPDPPDRWKLRLWPNPSRVARIVDSILDEISQLDGGAASLSAGLRASADPSPDHPFTPLT